MVRMKFSAAKPFDSFPTTNGVSLQKMVPSKTIQLVSWRFLLGAHPDLLSRKWARALSISLSLFECNASGAFPLTRDRTFGGRID